MGNFLITLQKNVHIYEKVFDTEKKIRLNLKNNQIIKSFTCDISSTSEVDELFKIYLREKVIV